VSRSPQTYTIVKLSRRTQERGALKNNVKHVLCFKVSNVTDNIWMIELFHQLNFHLQKRYWETQGEPKHTITEAS